MTEIIEPGLFFGLNLVSRIPCTLNLIPYTMTGIGSEKLLEVGSNIRKWRNLKGMKQESLAEELDISSVAVSKIETGKTNIPVKRLFAIAAALNINIQLLFTDPDNIIQQIENKNGNGNMTKFLSLKNINS